MRSLVGQLRCFAASPANGAAKSHASSAACMCGRLARDAVDAPCGAHTLRLPEKQRYRKSVPDTKT